MNKALEKTNFELEYVVETLLEKGNTSDIRRFIDKKCHLSESQRRLWFVNQVEGDQVTYNFPSAVEIKGKFDTNLFRESMQRVIRNNKILTAKFFEVDGVPYQQFDPNIKVDLPVIDLTGLPEDAQQMELALLVDDHASITFNLARGPLFACKVLKLGEDKHVLLMNQHHIITDGWSSTLFNADVADCYRSLIDGQEPEEQKQLFDYSDYIYWQKAISNGGRRGHLLKTWKERLSGVETLRLPLDRERTESTSIDGAHHLVTLDKNQKDELTHLAKKYDSSLYMVLLSVYKVALHSYFKQTDVVVGTSVANRTMPELESVYGLFANQVALRTSLSGNPVFSEIVDRVKNTTNHAFENQDMPFDSLVSEMDVERKPGESVIFQTLFLFNNFPDELRGRSDIEIRDIDTDIGASRFDLSLTVEERRGLSIKFTYKKDLFDKSTIEKLSLRYLKVIEKILLNDKFHLSEIIEDISMEDKIKEISKRGARFSRRERKPVKSASREIVEISGEKGVFPYIAKPSYGKVELSEWLQSKREIVESKVAESGAILFRGFDIDTPQRFEKVARAYCLDLFGNYGDLPKEDGGERIYKSTPYPNTKAILFHNEASHTQRWPMKQMFAGIIPAETGGETPLVDCRKVYDSLDDSIISKLREKKLMYVRNFVEGLDVPWQDFFKTNSKSEVERICAEDNVGCEWVSDNHLRTKKISQAICQHPKTGENLFFNQIQLHHISYMDQHEIDSLLTLFSVDDLPRNVYYGDGEELESSVIEAINLAYDQNAFVAPWQKGDFIVLDNMLVAHARKPFTGDRRVVVAMGDLVSSDCLEAEMH